MTIPPKYEDVVAKLADATDTIEYMRKERVRAEEREAALREELEQALATGKSYMEMSEDLQQRLTVAEQLLREVRDSGDWHSSALEFIRGEGFEVLAKIEAELKPAEDPFGVLAETGMTYPEFMRSTFQERHKLTDAECEEFHAWKNNKDKPAAEGEGS